MLAALMKSPQKFEFPPARLSGAALCVLSVSVDAGLCALRVCLCFELFKKLMN